MQRISFKAKVLRVEQPSTVSQGLKLQNIVVSDSTLAVKMAIWENDIGKLEDGKSYHFTNFVVKNHQGDRYIQWPKDGAQVDPIDNLTDVKPDDAPMLPTVEDSEIVGVRAFDSFDACFVCKCKVVKQDEQDTSGTCSNCGMCQRLNRCSKMLRAKLLLTKPGGEYITLNVFGNHLQEIAGSTDVTKDRQSLSHFPMISMLPYGW